MSEANTSARRSSSNEPELLGAMALDPGCPLEVPAGADGLSGPQRFSFISSGGVQEPLSLKSPKKSNEAGLGSIDPVFKCFAMQQSLCFS